MARARLIALLLLAGLIVPAPAALAGTPTKRPESIGVKLVGVPLDSHADPLARVYVVGALAPGTTMQRRIEISNATAAAADITVYPAAADLRRGTFSFAPGHGRNDLSSWTSMSRDGLRLQPETTAVETVTIVVPRSASFGERYAVVWAEVSKPAPSAGGVTLVNRVGIRLYITIKPGGALGSSFAIGPLGARRSSTGEPVVRATIRNGGASTLDIGGTLTLSHGPGGLRAGPFPVKLATMLAPGRSRALSVTLDRRLPRGPWRARLVLRSGSVHREAAATVSFPRFAGVAKPRAASHRVIGFAALILVLLAAAAAAIFFHGRGTGSQATTDQIAPTVRSAG